MPLLSVASVPLLSLASIPLFSLVSMPLLSVVSVHVSIPRPNSVLLVKLVLYLSHVIKVISGRVAQLFLFNWIILFRC